MAEMLALDFMQRALLAALLVGLAAPLVGIFLVQRRLALIGDGMGHVALAGVAVGVLTGSSPVWAALVAALVAAVVVELIRTSGRSQGDVALAIIFYGGIAASVVIISASPKGTPANLTAYLFGAITTVQPSDLWVFGALTALIIGTVSLLRWRLYAVASDEEYARSAGMPVLALNLALAVLTAITVVVSMRVVGLLLISALMIVPNAAAQVLGRSFRSSLLWAVVIGLVSSVGGVVISYAANAPSGGTIVLIAIGWYLVAAVGAAVWARGRRRGHREAEGHGHEHGPDCGHEAIPHDDHVDYLHDGHLHAPHLGHYDEHADHAELADHVERDGHAGHAGHAGHYGHADHAEHAPYVPMGGLRPGTPSGGQPAQRADSPAPREGTR